MKKLTKQQMLDIIGGWEGGPNPLDPPKPVEPIITDPGPFDPGFPVVPPPNPEDLFVPPFTGPGGNGGDEGDEGGEEPSS